MATPDEDFAVEAPQRSLQASVMSDATPPSSNDVLPPPVRLKSTLKAPNDVAMEPAAGGGKLCHNPVTARSGKDMIGAHTERSTGITYPYNMWGPCNPTRFGPVGEMPPERGHRYNYQGKHELLEIMSNEEASRRHNAQKMRDIKYQAYLDLSKEMQKVGCRNNLSGAPHINIITREPIGEYNIKVVKFRDDCTQYKRAQRTLMLQERNSGARSYNILNWTKNPLATELPPWPEKPPSPPPPPSPDTRTPLNSSKAAISCGRLYGAFGKFNIP